jgi:hypothetical protein
LVGQRWHFMRIARMEVDEICSVHPVHSLPIRVEKLCVHGICHFPRGISQIEPGSLRIARGSGSQTLQGNQYIQT